MYHQNPLRTTFITSSTSPSSCQQCPPTRPRIYPCAGSNTPNSCQACLTSPAAPWPSGPPREVADFVKKLPGCGDHASKFGWRGETFKIFMFFVWLNNQFQSWNFNFEATVKTNNLNQFASEAAWTHTFLLGWANRWASYTRIWIFVCFAGRLVNTPRVACHHGDWRVYNLSKIKHPGGSRVIVLSTKGTPRPVTPFFRIFYFCQITLLIFAEHKKINAWLTSQNVNNVYFFRWQKFILEINLLILPKWLHLKRQKYFKGLWIQSSTLHCDNCYIYLW